MARYKCSACGTSNDNRTAVADHVRILRESQYNPMHYRKATLLDTGINASGGVGTTQYGPQLPDSALRMQQAQNEWNSTRAAQATQRQINDGALRMQQAQNEWNSTRAAQARASSGSSSGSTSIVTSRTAPSSGPTAWSVAQKSGLSGGDINIVLNKSLAKFNAQNGTNFQLNSSGHIRQNGTGGWMTQGQHNAFLGSIPVNAVNYKYDLAIDKAIAGNATDLKNLDRFFTGAERASTGYTAEYLKLEKRARAAGISVDKQKANESALATGTKKLIRGDAAFGPDDGAANTGNGAAVFAVNSKGEKFHVTAAAAAEMRANGTWTEPVVVSQSIVDKMAFKGRLGSAAELKNINKFETPVPVAVVSSGSPLVTQAPESNANQQKDGKKENSGPQADIDAKKAEAQAKAVAAQAQQDEKQAEGLTKAAAAQAQADERKAEALATATANKQSAKEARMNKIAAMRKPWMGGGASASNGADAMVAPPIIPASQVPPPPFQ